MLWQRGFWVIFASFSVFHLVEDLFWAIIARYTPLPILIIVGGILLWAFVSTLFIHSKPVKKYWHGKNNIDEI